MNLKMAKKIRKYAKSLSVGLPLNGLQTVNGRAHSIFHAYQMINKQNTFRSIYRDLKRIVKGRKSIWHEQ